MRFMRLAAAGWLAVVVVLSGCATPPQTPVPLASGAFAAGAPRVGVAMTPLPAADTYFPGADCLLCIAAASMMNSSLTAHVRTLPQEDLPKLKAVLADAVRKSGGKPKVIDEPLKLDALPKSSAKGPNLSEQDFSSLAAAHEIDKLMVVSVRQLGFERSYSAYIPTSDPKAVLYGVAFMVDLKTNTFEWYQPLKLVRSSDGPWDESTAKYPGLTNAYFQVLELGKDEVLRPFQP